MTINVSPAHPFVHTHTKITTHKALFLEWHLRFSMDMYCFSKYIQCRGILQSFLEKHFYFWALLSTLKPLKMFFYGFRITLFPQKPQFRPNKRRESLSVHKGVERNLEEFVRNTKQKRLSFTVWISSKEQAIYQQVNTSSCTAVAQFWMWWLYSDPLNEQPSI